MNIMNLFVLVAANLSTVPKLLLKDLLIQLLVTAVNKSVAQCQASIRYFVNDFCNRSFKNRIFVLTVITEQNITKTIYNTAA